LKEIGVFIGLRRTDGTLAGGERGSAPVLAIFTIFILFSCTLAIWSFQESDQRSVSATQQLVAADVTRATASTIESELNQALSTAVTAAMYDVGSTGGDRGDVERLTLEYFNQRISHGWSYPNLEVGMPQISDEDLVFEWQPDGSARVWGYLGAEFKHVYGPTAHGVRLEVSVSPRFLRIENVAWRMLRENFNVLDVNRYAAEGLEVELVENDTHVTAIVRDVFAGPCAVVGGSMEFVRYIASKKIDLLPPVTPSPPSQPSQPPQASPPTSPPSTQAPAPDYQQIQPITPTNPPMNAIDLSSEFYLAFAAYDGGSVGGQMTRVYTVEVTNPTRIINGIRFPNYLSFYLNALVGGMPNVSLNRPDTPDY